jgi:hypothetical protein
MKRLGPELKKPDVKAPAFLEDIYYDLRERRLLPLVALFVVAIAAVPFLLGESEEAVAPPPPSGLSSRAQQAVDSSSLKVVEATPGLRDYKKRLAHREPRDPFHQRFTSSVTKNAQLNEPSTVTTTSGSGEGGGGTSGSSGYSPPPSSTPVTTPSSSGRHGELTLFAYAINVRITKQGGAKASGKKAKPIVKERVLPQTPLPGEKAPVVTFMGPARTKDNKATGRALLLVSNEVKSVFGETRCVTGEEVCQLIEVEPGFPVTFVYGENEVRYTINVLKLSLVVTGRKRYSREKQMLIP